MTPRLTRSLWTAFTATVVGFTAFLVGCASLGPLTARFTYRRSSPWLARGKV